MNALCICLCECCIVWVCLTVCVSKRLLFCAGWVRLLPAHSMPCALYNWWQKRKKKKKRDKNKRSLELWNEMYIFFRQYTLSGTELISVVCPLCLLYEKSHVYNSIWFVTNKPVYIKSVYQWYAYFFYIYIFIFSVFLTPNSKHDWHHKGPPGLCGLLMAGLIGLFAGWHYEIVYDGWHFVKCC